MYIKSSTWSGFEIKNWIKDQFQSSPKLVGISTVLRCIFVSNLEIVTSISGELWHGQAQNGVNFDFGVQFDLEGQGQLPPKTIGILTNVFCTSGPDLVIPASMGDELWWEQAQNGISFDSDLKFGLEGQSQLPPKTIGTLTKVFCIFGPNLVIPAWTGDELSHRQTWWRTQATTLPGGQNWPRVKMASISTWI